MKKQLITFIALCTACMCLSCGDAQRDNPLDPNCEKCGPGYGYNSVVLSPSSGMINSTAGVTSIIISGAVVGSSYILYVGIVNASTISPTQIYMPISVDGTGSATIDFTMATGIGNTMGTMVVTGNPFTVMVIGTNGPVYTVYTWGN